jgi:hypothetical protein
MVWLLYGTLDVFDVADYESVEVSKWLDEMWLLHLVMNVTEVAAAGQRWKYLISVFSRRRDVAFPERINASDANLNGQESVAESGRLSRRQAK